MRLFPIPGYEGKYSIDKKGNVYSHFSGRYLKGGVSSGYKSVGLGKGNTKRVHRLVLEAFKPKDKDDNRVCNHIDGDKLNNNLNNLEWVTQSENILHAISIGAFKRQKIFKDDLDKIDKMLKIGLTRHEIARCFNVSHSHICVLMKGKYL